MKTVTFSEMQSFADCPRKHQLRYEIGWKSRTVGVATIAGAALHRAAEEHYRGRDMETALRAIRSVFDTYLNARSPEDAEKYIDAREDAVTAWRAYINHYKNDDFKVKDNEVETEFLVPIFTPSGRASRLFRLAGKIDLIVEEDGAWITDHKSKASISEKDGDRLVMDLQMLSYAHSYQVYTGTKIRGCCYNMIKRKPPKVPKINKNGTVSKAACDTTVEIYLETLKKHNQSPSDYQQILEKLEGNKFFARFWQEYTEDDYKQIQMNLYQLSLQMHQCQWRYKNTAACDHWGGCRYRPICMGQAADEFFDLSTTKHSELELKDLHLPFGRGYNLQEWQGTSEYQSMDDVLEAVNA